MSGRHENPELVSLNCCVARRPAQPVSSLFRLKPFQLTMLQSFIVLLSQVGRRAQFDMDLQAAERRKRAAEAESAFRANKVWLGIQSALPLITSHASIATIFVLA